jgi:nucleotide-binding universal stress UspA family protein
MDEDLYPHVKDGASHRMKSLMDDYLKEGNKGEAIVQIERKPSKAITDYAAENGYDLIVMAARGEHSSDLLRGSITEKVIRHSSVPVFTVDNRLKAGGIKRILLPTDASLLSFKCLPMVLALANIYDAEITLFHVRELYGSLSESMKRRPGNTDESDIYESIIEKLGAFLDSHKLQNIEIKRGDREMEDELVVTGNSSSKSFPLNTVIEKGLSAHYEIENYAPSHSDLIVMTTHGHSGLAHFFLGSTTEKVALLVDMPVLTVKPPKEELEQATS